MEKNPLSDYFRQPSIYIKLPSDGKYYPKDAVDIPANGELPVYPMTTKDEITYRTPDALFNGNAVVSVIQSCVPNIRNAWKMPSMDLDTVLIAIRIATYGHEMEIGTVCPSCTTEANYGVDLRVMLDNVRPGDYSQPLKLGDLEIYLKPMDYQQMNANSMAQFEEQKMLQSVQDSAVSDEQKLGKLSDVLRKITDITTEALANNISAVHTPHGHVSDITHIRDWLANTDRGTFAQVRDYVVKVKQQSEMQPLKITCKNCQNQYEQLFTLDMTNFFEDAS